MWIVEMSRDQFWGTGIHMRDTGYLDPSCWYNSGILMEEVLVAVRAKLFPKPKQYQQRCLQQTTKGHNSLKISLWSYHIGMAFLDIKT